ncbi:YitT family protein [Azotosporobacter soli]|uniref:YitT family protein n=1 Tax=Azotosporobacter soli TaxID=3055040 RepID=UPI0031FEA1F4
MKKLVVKDYIGMTVGIFLLAVSLNMFLIPNKVAAGGISGLATVLYHLTGWPVGVVMLVFNIPLFLIGVKILGARYGMNTLYGAAMLSIIIDVTAPYTPVMTHDLLLASLYGGVVGGVGCGLIFRFKGNTAGTALMAAILNKVFGIRIGQALLMSDFGVIVFAGVVFQSPELALYALISIFVCAQIIDLVQEGPTTAKAFFVVSNKPQEVGDMIIEQMDRGVTYWQARGGYTGDQREMLLSVVGQGEISQLKEIVYQLDPKAFVIVADAHEVLGEGFKETPIK